MYMPKLFVAVRLGTVLTARESILSLASPFAVAVHNMNAVLLEKQQQLKEGI